MSYNIDNICIIWGIYKILKIIIFMYFTGILCIIYWHLLKIKIELVAGISGPAGLIVVSQTRHDYKQLCYLNQSAGFSIRGSAPSAARLNPGSQSRWMEISWESNTPGSETLGVLDPNGVYKPPWFQIGGYFNMNFHGYFKN